VEVLRGNRGELGIKEKLGGLSKELEERRPWTVTLSHYEKIGFAGSGREKDHQIERMVGKRGNCVNKARTNKRSTRGTPKKIEFLINGASEW